MNIAIVDDLPAEIEALTDILTDYAGVSRLDFDIRSFDSGEALLADYEALRYTVVFLDIYMGGITGIETAKKLREVDPDTLIIFLTTSMEHMGSAFSIHAYDYIEKPATRDRLFRLMDDILKTHTSAYERTFDFISDRKATCLPIPDIISVCTGEMNYLDVLDKSGDVFHPRMTFSDACDELLQLDPRFLQVNRGVLVNMDYVVRLEDGDCTMKSGTIYPVFIKKREQTEQKWQNYNFNKLRSKQRRTKRRSGDSKNTEKEGT